MCIYTWRWARSWAWQSYLFHPPCDLAIGRVYAHICAYIRLCMQTYVRMCARAHVHTHIYTNTHTETQIDTHTHTYMYTYRRDKLSYTRTHRYKHTHTRTHTLGHTQTNTHTHTYTCGCVLHLKLGVTFAFSPFHLRKWIVVYVNGMSLHTHVHIYWDKHTCIYIGTFICTQTTSTDIHTCIYIGTFLTKPFRHSIYVAFVPLHCVFDIVSQIDLHKRACPHEWICTRGSCESFFSIAWLTFPFVQIRLCILKYVHWIYRRMYMKVHNSHMFNLCVMYMLRAKFSDVIHLRVRRRSSVNLHKCHQHTDNMKGVCT